MSEGSGMRPKLLALLRDERVRFVLVGGFNTVFQFALFAIFDQGDRSPIRYLGSLYGSYAIAIIAAFFLHRRFTFRANASGNALVDFFRFASVYVVSLVINTALLPLLVETVKLSPLFAQAIVTVVTVLLSYFGHKYFSFRRRHDEGDPSEPDGTDHRNDRLLEAEAEVALQTPRRRRRGFPQPTVDQRANARD